MNKQVSIFFHLTGLDLMGLSHFSDFKTTVDIPHTEQLLIATWQPSFTRLCYDA